MFQEGAERGRAIPSLAMPATWQGDFLRLPRAEARQATALLSYLLSRAHLASQLLESDAVYFELGAMVKRLPAADFVYVPGFGNVSAGCVVQRVRSAYLPGSLTHWLRKVDAEFKNAGAQWKRIYLTEPAPALERALEKAGYRQRREIGFLSPAAVPPEPVHTTWRRVEACDWDWKVAIRGAEDMNSDGYLTSPEQWAALMRIKERTGRKEPYLLLRGGVVCGEVAVMETPDILRLKNLYVAPAWRGKGVARDAVHLVWREALRRGKSGIGTFGLEGEPGAEVYRRAGLREETCQVEWSSKV